MPRLTQAWRRGSPAVAALALLWTAVALTGCGTLSKAESDRSIITSALPTDSHGKPSAEDVSDQVTIRNAVTSANLADLKGAPISWANVETGAQGSISGIGEYQEKGSTCRRFSASRESFSGVALFGGDTCLGTGGAWWMRAFNPL